MGLKKIIYRILFTLLLSIGLFFPFADQTFAKNDAPEYNKDFVSTLKGESDNVVVEVGVSKDNTILENMQILFYPGDNDNRLYDMIKTLTLGLMIIFFVRSGSSLLFSRDPKTLSKTLHSMLYILLGGLLIYGANRIIGDVVGFSNNAVAPDFDQFTNNVNNKLMLAVLSIIRAAAFFVAIVMIVITGFKVVMAGEEKKGKELAKGIINVVLALFIIKGVDFIYYMVGNVSTVMATAKAFIINIAKIFAYIYGVVVVIMVIFSGYLYVTDGGSGSGFKKASNILVNILLSGLVLFSFLLIIYQLIDEFTTGGGAVGSS